MLRMEFGSTLRDKIFNVEKSHDPLKIVTAGILSIFLIDLADFYIGSDIHLSVLLLVPIYFTVWYVNFRSGVLLSVLGSAYMWVDYIAHPEYYRHFWVPIWNMAVLLVFFLAFCWVLDLLRMELKKARRVAKTDALTGLLNPRGFYEAVERERARSERHGHPLTLLYFDLDNFKHVNDRYGHTTGDKLLREVAGIMTARVREGDSVARMGGDEFAVLFPETGLESIREIAAKIHDAINKEVQVHDLVITASIGVVAFQKMPERVEEIVRATDMLMYEAKRSGKNKILFKAAGPSP